MKRTREHRSRPLHRRLRNGRQQVRQDQLVNDLSNACPGFKPDETPSTASARVLLANTEGGAPVGSVTEGVALGEGVHRT